MGKQKYRVFVYEDFTSKPVNFERSFEMARNEKTSKRVGKTASSLLRSKSTSRKVKSVAGSALTQRPDKKKKR